MPFLETGPLQIWGALGRASQVAWPAPGLTFDVGTLGQPAWGGSCRQAPPVIYWESVSCAPSHPHFPNFELFESPAIHSFSINTDRPGDTESLSPDNHNKGLPWWLRW